MNPNFTEFHPWLCKTLETQIVLRTLVDREYRSTQRQISTHLLICNNRGALYRIIFAYTDQICTSRLSVELVAEHEEIPEQLKLLLKAWQSWSFDFWTVTMPAWVIVKSKGHLKPGQPYCLEMMMHYAMLLGALTSQTDERIGKEPILTVALLRLAAFLRQRTQEWNRELARMIPLLETSFDV